MPFLELTIPRLEKERKQQLAENLTREFIDATGFENEILSIRFAEYGPGEAAVNGKLWVENEGHPYSTILVMTPRLRHDVKRALAAGLARVCAEHLPDPGWAPVIHILEFPYENIEVDGQLLTDADEELSSRPFYYVLPR